MAYLVVSVNNLRKGMVIAKDVYTNMGTTLVSEGTPVSKEVINLLTRHFIPTVTIEYVAEGAEVSHLKKVEKTMEMKLQEFEEQIQIAEENLSENIKDIVYKSRDIQVSSLLDTLNGIIDKTDNETNLIDMMLRMKKTKKGFFSHSINVALWGQILAEWLKCKNEEIEQVVVCGLLHDIGLMRLSDEKIEAFSFRDELEDRDHGKHCIDGYNLIKDQKIDLQIKQAVLTHHERLDGSGFPLKASHQDINKISRIVAIAEQYDLLTTSETGEEALSPFLALKRMEEDGCNRLDASFLMTFVSNIAETLIQHEVVLSNGKRGRVVMINKYDVSRPLVQVGDAFVDLSKNTDLYVKEILD